MGESLIPRQAPSGWFRLASRRRVATPQAFSERAEQGPTEPHWAPIIGFALLALALLPAASRAQISPGKLARAHVELEGSDRCLSCHSSNRGVDPAQCFSCHRALDARVKAGKGLHAKADYRACERCHIDHQGRDFELIFWGKEGMAAFNHRQAGFELEGAHALQACRDCHTAAKQVAKDLAARGADPATTFLGLGTTCLSCHQDPHAGQFEAQLQVKSCASCHGQTTWKPAVGFDHAKTSFPLTGSHAAVTCQRCHTSDGKGGKAVVRFRGVATACASCHRDPHQNRFGARCESCHQTRDWNEINRSGFDHSKTRYPLAGKHTAIACEACHGTNTAKDIEGFERCATCHHDDPHAGQFAASPKGNDCAGCHGLKGFRPSTFSVADHETTSYPLAGAHRKITCRECHGPVSPEQLERDGVALSLSAARPATLLRFRFQATDCPACHRDPHQGDAAAAKGTSGCLSCHNPETWKKVGFDHDTTGFVLAGAHRATPCTACHRPSAVAPAKLDSRAKEGRLLRLSGAAKTCAGCHADPHQGQFDRDGQATNCIRCHGEVSWSPVGFDHEKVYKLEGAHRAVACLSCHPNELKQGKAVVRYRPLGRECSDCHQTLPTPTSTVPP